MNCFFGGKFLSNDWVEKAKFLFFIKIKIISYLPKRGKRLNKIKKNKNKKKGAQKEKKNALVKL